MSHLLTTLDVKVMTTPTSQFCLLHTQEPLAYIGIPPTAPMLPLKPPKSSAMDSFVWALVILGAIRLGRTQAEAVFLDYDAIRVISPLDSLATAASVNRYLLVSCLAAHL